MERLIWDKLNDAENGAAQSGRFKDKNSNIDLGNNNVGHNVYSQLIHFAPLFGIYYHYNK